MKTGAMGILAVFLALQAWTASGAPDEDFRAGSQAYRRGDVVQAMDLLRKSADAEYAPAQSLLAYILDKSGASEEAVAYYRKAAAQGDADGEFGLGSMYAAGEGVKRDPAEARKWVTRAAEKGHAGAVNTLALAYIKGDLGIEESQRKGDEALRWVRRASDSGYLPAMEHLALAYRTGAHGLEVDVREADALDARVRAARGAADKRAAKRKDRR
jgi:TPR repeat protein